MSEWNPPVIDTRETHGEWDRPPRDGGAADEDGWAGVQLDPDVVEEGNQLGAAIDVDDDTDNGGIPVVAGLPAVEPVNSVEGPVSPDMDPSVPTPGEAPDEPGDDVEEDA